MAAAETPTGSDGAPPRVEIGMPTRSGGPYFAQAVESVLSQTFRDWRLIVAENGPGDEGLAAALEPYLKDDRIQHVVRGEDIGPEGNHNALIRDFRAEYVAFLHDDDFWAPEFLERRVASTRFASSTVS